MQISSDIANAPKSNK